MELVAISNLLLLLFGRFFIRIFIKVFGWVLAAYFGTLPEDKDNVLSAMLVLSMLWLAILIGQFLPFVVEFLLSYIPHKMLREYVSFFLVTAGLFLMPLFVGGFVARLKIQGELGFLRCIWREGMRGYWYCIEFGAAGVLMFLFAPLIMLWRYLRRMDAINIPFVEKNGTDRPVDAFLHKAFGKKWSPVATHTPGFLYTLPLKLAAEDFSSLFGGRQPNDFCIVVGKSMVYFHPYDFMVEGKKEEANQIAAYLADKLIAYDGYMTWSKEAQRLEEECRLFLKKYQNGEIEKIQAIEGLTAIREALQDRPVAYFEWEILIRKSYAFQEKLWQKRTS